MELQEQQQQKKSSIFLEAEPIDFTGFPKKVKEIYNDSTQYLKTVHN